MRRKLGIRKHYNWISHKILELEKLSRKIKLDLHSVGDEAVDKNDSWPLPDNIENVENWVGT